MKSIPYEYRNLPIPGGGYVTGFLFSPVEKNVMYIRTDIGGTYRYNYNTESFESLINHVTMENLSETFPISIATRKDVKGSLYIACGVDHGPNGILAISKDYGRSFTYKKLPVPAHGNWNGRGTSERLAIAENGDIYFASPQNGLYLSKDEGSTWKQLYVFGEEYFTFVFLRPGTKTVVVGCAGVTTRMSDELRGHSLYISYDGGDNFKQVREPFIGKMPKSRLTGFVAHRYAYDGRDLYITMNHTGERAYVLDTGYSSDGGHVIGGVVLKYSFDENGEISEYRNISPRMYYLNMDYGYGGISISKTTPGLMVLSTITRLEGDIVYRSWDYGETWEKVLEGLSVGKITFRAPYMRPECNGNGSLIHWLTDIQINPFNDDEVWFNTGTGVFRCDNFTDKQPEFTDHCDGIEETVHLNLYAPTGGPVQLIDILGDLGGFAFTDVDKPCDNSFADSNRNRYITCINADCSDLYPECTVVTPRGNWTGKTKGGLIISKDACKSFDRVELPYGLSERLDEQFKAIEQPNVNAGWVSMSPDTRRLVWSVADFIRLPKEMVIYSPDSGDTWQRTTIHNCEDKFFKTYSDRVNSDIFYGFTENGNFYVSNNGGADFEPVDIKNAFSGTDFGFIDCANRTEIRVESGREGHIYLACGLGGLWKIVYDKESRSAEAIKLSKSGDIFYRLGLGLISEDADYMNSDKALYVCATLSGEYGFYRSFDEGKTFERINTASQMYGEINSLEADKRIFGRFYLATGSRGVLYGQPIKEV